MNPIKIIKVSPIKKKKDRHVIKLLKYITAQKMKFSIKDFFSKCDQIRSFLRI